ncbi:MAG: hypothetical protein ACRDJJ_05385 [Actinomycetota bacterium]
MGRGPLVAAALSALIACAALPAGAESTSRLTLRAGKSVFWAGPFVRDSGGDSSWTYRLTLAEAGYRLRLGIDHPEVGDVFEVDVFDPSGRRAGSLSPGTGLYSAELLVRDPRPGTWRIRVRAEDVTRSAFRLRAKLESDPPRIGTGKDPVLPNLQVLPPHDASFLTPLTNGSTGGAPQGIDLLGAESCHPEEHAEDRALRCLRFSFGIRNTGLGPMQLYYEGDPPQDQTMYQRVRRADGSHFDREAGVARWYKTHLHFHHHDAVALRLFGVTDPNKGKLVPAGDKRRKGFAHRDELLREWRHFYPTLGLVGFGLSAGWSDIYEWDRPGNYIDFGLNGDGRYLIRMWADPVGGILESNEEDNIGYTYFRVSGAELELIEAGRGRDPWDRCKIVVGFGGHPDPPRSPRPDDCPPDTT